MSETSLLDSIGSTLSETYDKVMANEATEPVATAEAETPEVAEETTEERAERLRDEKGRFARAQEDATAAEVAEAPDEPEEVAPAPSKPAPGSWPKEMKERFGSLPAEVQDYVLQREADVSRSINQFSVKAKAYDQIAGVLSPYEPLLRADGLEPVGVINGLMQTYYTLRNGAPQQKAAAVMQLAQQFGVDLGQSQDGQQPGNSAYDPQVYDKLAKLEQQLLQRQYAEEQAAEREVMTTIEQFRANAPHFEAVKAHMGALLANGAARDMQDAYDQACWANPEVRATLLQEQEAKRRAEQAKVTAEAKKAASVNVSRRGTQPPAKAQGSIEDTLRETYARLTSS